MQKPMKIEQTEEQIPLLAEQAIRQAVATAMAAGKSVLVTQNDIVYEVFADGSKQTLTHVSPRLHVEPGTIRTLPQ